ncbi:hypothetical protein ACQPVP_11675 [Clostridium nigeriense]
MLNKTRLIGSKAKYKSRFLRLRQKYIKYVDLISVTRLKITITYTMKIYTLI